MGAPVQIPGLPSASVANDADLAVIRQGLTDFKVTVALLRNINLAGLNALPSNVQNTDLMLIARSGSNFRIPFSSIGFPVGTKMWFYMNSAQITASLPAWRIVPNTGDALIATAGGTTYTVAASQQGTWTIPAITLGIQNIPQHEHYIPVQKQASNVKIGHSNDAVLAGSLEASPQINGWIESFSTGGQGSTIFATNPQSPSQKPTFNGAPSAPTESYSQGDTWRPRANVGNICEKIA